MAIGPSDAVEEAWIRLQADYDPAEFAIGGAMDALRLLEWSLEFVAPSAFGVAKAQLFVPEVREGIATAELRMELKNKKRDARVLYILDQRNYGRELLNALKQVAGKRDSITKVVLRLREKFPATGASKLLEPLNAIKGAGGIVGDLLDPEMLLLSQLRQFQAEVPDEDFSIWIRGKVLQLPALRACVRPR
jgi:hypothetical protein